MHTDPALSPSARTALLEERFFLVRALRILTDERQHAYDIDDRELAHDVDRRTPPLEAALRANWQSLGALASLRTFFHRRSFGAAFSPPPSS